jgi:hypothetical protein
MLSCDFRRLVAVGLVFSTVLITMPVSAADFSTTKSVIGSVSAVGPVELRGIGISQEGTLFAGDRIHAGQKGYAKVLLGTGSKIEVSEQSDINVNRDAQGVKIAMNTGTVGFTANSPLRIDILPFEVTATDGASGHVAVMGSNAAGVRAVNGKVTVRNLKTSESFVIVKGQERLFALQGGVRSASLAELASNVPLPIPAPVPQAPAGRTSSGLAMDTGAWLAVIGGAAIGGIAIWGLVTALNNRDDIKDLKATINNLNNTIASGTNQQQLKNLANASAISSTTAQLSAQQGSTAALASQAQSALAAAGNAAGAAQAAAIANTAASLQNQLSALQTQIQALQSQLAAGGGSTAQVTALLSQEETLRGQSNTNTTNLNNLLNTFRTTPGVPQTSVATVGGPAQASATLPI